jgi:DNA polymerase I-like protein with 3'-5' exonuclease and polymerase domains
MPATNSLLLLLLSRMQCEGVLPALTTIEMPLVRVLKSMEAQGVCLSQDALRQQRPALERRLQQLEVQAAAAVGGRRFNLAAPAEVGRVSVCGGGGVGWGWGGAWGGAAAAAGGAGGCCCWG